MKYFRPGCIRCILYQHSKRAVICIFKRPTPTISLSVNSQGEYQRFPEDMFDEGRDIKAESSAVVYRGNYRKYEKESLNSIQREIDILEKRIMQRKGKEVDLDRQKLKNYGLCGGLIALLIAGKMLYALEFTKKKKVKYIDLHKPAEHNKQL